MDNEILDEGFETKEKNRIQIMNWISLIMLWFGIGYCGISGLFGELKVIVAIVLLIFATAITYFNYELGVKITLGIILVGVLNLVDFLPIKYLIRSTSKN